MTTVIGISGGLAARLNEVHRLCPEMRFGQMLATIGLLAEDATGHNLWDVDDDEFAVAVDRFVADLSRRQQPPESPC